MDDKAHSANYFETASFAYFEMQGSVKVTITCPEVVQCAKVRPSSCKITPSVNGKSLSFTITARRTLVEVNGDWIRSLHLLPIRQRPKRPRQVTRRSFSSVPTFTRSAAWW